MVFRKLMSMVLVCFLVYDLLFLMPCNEVFAESWYPFDIPMDDALSNAIDVGKIVLDAPAGKHGFLTVKDGHFYFEDGTRTKFWGANLTFKACFPSHENAEKTAAHLAKYGFNIVRIHHIDTLNEPQGIFDSTTGDTKTLSEDQLEKLDYLIFKLKEKGIYVDLNLHVGRNFTGKDGVTSADSLPENSKIVTLYDDKLIELQKDYAKKLLKHYNPYTKKMYSEEPAIALVEITNENSIYPAWTDGALFGQPGEVDYKNPLPGYYVKELDMKWNEWLKNKYGTTENLKKAWSLKDSGISNYIDNPGFETEWEGYWRSELHGTTASFTRDASEKNSGNYSLCANIGTINAEDYGVQFKQLGIKLEKGKNYRLSFYAKADRERAINVSYMQNESPWNGYGLAANFDLKKQWGLYSVEFTVNREVTSDSKVSFILGGSLGKVWIDDIKLEEVKISYVGSDESIEDSTVRRTDWKDRYKVTDKRFADNTEFYYSLEKSFFDDMISYLKKDLGLRVPVSTSNFYFGQPDLMAQLSGDFMNTHAYWDHPIFNGGEDIIENYSQSNGSVIRDVGNTKGKIEFSSFIERIALSTVQGKPLVVSEWNSPYPNEYEYEMASLITAYGLLQGWEGLFVYSYSNNFNETSETKKIDCMFNIINNPVKMSQMPLCSLMFLRNDIKEAEKTIKLRYNRDEAISEYKYNSGSRKLQIVEGYIPASAVLNHKILHGNFDYEEKAYLKHFFTEDQLNELIEEADHISDTNELTLKSSVKNKEYFVVDTNRVQGVNGFISGQSIKTKDIKFSLSTNAAAFLVTLDYKPIPESVKMLFFLSARQKNSGQTKNADLTKITNLGSGPALLEAVTGYVDINVNANASLYEAYSLDGSGERLAKKKVEVISSNTIRIYLDGNSPWLEIIRSSNTSPINNVTPTATPIKTPTATPIKTPTATPIKTPTTTPIKTPTQTPIKTPTATPIKTPTQAPIQTPTPVIAKILAQEPTPLQTSTPTLTPTPLQTQTPIQTPTQTPMQTSTPTPAPTPTPKLAAIPAQDPAPIIASTPASTPAKTLTPMPTQTALIYSHVDEGVDLNDSYHFQANNIRVEIKKISSSSIKNISNKITDIKLEEVPLYQVKAYSDNKEITEIYEPIEVSLPYNAQTGKDVKKICAFGIENDGSILNLGGDYKQVTNCHVFQVSKLQPFFIKDNNVEYTDLNSVNWAKTFIETLAAKGIVQGMGKSEFKPNELLTRAQFITMLVKALKLDEAAPKATFSDVKESDWYYRYVNAAYKSKIINGMPDGGFSPNSPITRQDMAVILSNVFTEMYKEQDIANLSNIQSFNDKNDIAKYAYTPLAKVIEKGLMQGTGNNTLAPKRYTIRAEAATVIYKLYYLDKN